jgi:hypothetical protein
MYTHHIAEDSWEVGMFAVASPHYSLKTLGFISNFTI